MGEFCSRLVANLLLCEFRRSPNKHMPTEISPTSNSRAKRIRITKRIVDQMGPGETIWDKDLVGFGVRLQRRDPSFVVKYSF